MSILSNNTLVARTKEVFLGLGGNVGDVVKSMLDALGDMQRSGDIKVIAKSHLYKTPPWGDLDQDDFINSCVKIQTALDPHSLLALLKAEEKTLKRVKSRRWGPRTIDMDILIFDDMTLEDDRLTIPHPRMTARAFVLLPLCDLAPEIEINAISAQDWLAQLDISDIRKLPDQKGWISGRC